MRALGFVRAMERRLPMKIARGENRLASSVGTRATRGDRDRRRRWLERSRSGMAADHAPARRSRLRYWIASARCDIVISSSPARFAIVRATRRMRVYAGVRACGQPQPLARRLEEPPPACIHATDAAHLAPRHLRVDRHAEPHEARLLVRAGGDHPGANRRRRLAVRSFLTQRCHRHPRHLHVQVDAIEERPGHARAVPVDQRW